MTKNPEYHSAPKASLERLVQVLAAYGAEPARWPAEERVELVAIASEYPDARMRSAAQLDTVLDALPAVGISADLTQKVIAAVPPSTVMVPVIKPTLTEWLADLWSWEPAWRPAAALASVVLIGIALGVVSQPPAQDHPAIDKVVEIEIVWETDFDFTDDELVIGYASDVEFTWDIGFDPAGIEMASFVVGNM